MAIPDRLPSLVLLVGFWVPAAAAGWTAAGFAHRSATRIRRALLYTVLTTFVLAWAAAWFLFHLTRIPPYIPGASADPHYAPPRVVAGLLVVAGALVLPGSAIACVLAFRSRRRSLMRASADRVSAQGVAAAEHKAR